MVTVFHQTDRCDLSLFQLGLCFLDNFLSEELSIPFELTIPT